MERDPFGTILFIASQRKIYMCIVLRYPLALIPVSLCHVDGKMHKPSRSECLTCIRFQSFQVFVELLVNLSSGRQFDAQQIDAM